jgi:hypothetical protein
MIARLDSSEEAKLENCANGSKKYSPVI